MIKCISYWSIPGGLENTCPVYQALTAAKAAGFDGLELAIDQQGVVHTILSEQECSVIRQMIEASGLTVQTLASGMSWGCCPTDPNPKVRKKSIDLYRAALQRAAWLGCDALLFVPGAVMIPWDKQFGPVKYTDAVKWARQAVGQLVRTAEKVKVDLCIENVWNGLFYSPVEFRDFIDSFDSPRVKAYFDVGNVLGYHQYPPHWIEILGKRIGRVHIKDFKRSVGNLTGFCELLEGDVPWKETMAALRKIGYRKTIVAEMLPPGPGLQDRTSQALTRIVAM